MKFNNVMKTFSLAAALGLGLTVFTPATHAESASAQKLVDALKALKVDQVDYLYAYLQSITISESEVNQIMANAEKAKEILSGVADASQLTTAKQVELSRLILDSAKLAQLQVAFVNDKGEAIDISNYTVGAAEGLNIVLKDKSGNVLATINPKKEDLQASATAALIAAFEKAVAAQVELAKEGGKFVPMPAAELPDTNSQDPAFVLAGLLIAMLGAAAFVPAVRFVRKSEVTEA